MKILILTMILAIGQAFVPVPRKTADNSTDAASGNKTDASRKNKPTQSPSPLISQGQPNRNGNNHDGVAPNDKANAIRISELPPVSVVPAKRNWADWAYLLFGLAVAVSASLQVYWLRRTLKEIRHQVEYMRDQITVMERQTKATELAVEAAETTAEATLNSQRAWILIVGVSPPGEIIFIKNERRMDFAFRFKFEVLGNTPTKIVDSRFRFLFVPGKRLEGTDKPDLPITPDYGHNPGGIPINTIHKPKDTFSATVNLENMPVRSQEWADIIKAKQILCAYGFIKYQDCFDGAPIRETRFCNVYRDSMTWNRHQGTDDINMMINANGFTIGGPEGYNKAT